MKLDEVSPLLDVHPPHEPVHGWRDFLLHIVTITIGLLIALGLEGVVEWQHQRHLVHEAEVSLHNEIQSNAAGMPGVIADLHKEQAALKNDVVVLNYILRNNKEPKNSEMSVDFRIVTFDSVSWKTAQATGALAYMPYTKSQQYADIYSIQDELTVAETQAARDAILAVGPFLDESDNDSDPKVTEARSIMEKIGVLQGQLLLVDNFLGSLDRHYKKFLAEDRE